MKTKVFIPFRDRGTDPRRAANLDVVTAWWYAHGFDVRLCSDGLEGDAQFNRHKAYNRAVSGNSKTDVFIFTEADMLIHPSQINMAVEIAKEAPGLVVPFTQYRYLSDSMTEILRDDFERNGVKKTAEFWSRKPGNGSVFDLTPETVMDNGSSIGAVNVVSRETLEITGGFTEITSGNWYDDRIIEEGFAHLTQVTRYVNGPAVHLYHLPGWTGDHLSDADKAATAHNKAVLMRLREYIRHDDKVAIKSLLAMRKGGIKHD